MNWLPILIPFVLLALGLMCGRLVEAGHYRSIKARERATLHRPAVTFHQPPPDRPIQSAEFAHGSVVISIDYFKRFLATLRMVFGGELATYAPLVDRARREALLRMKEAAPEADLFLNCRLETSRISRGGNDSVGTVEVYAYATAIRFADV